VGCREMMLIAPPAVFLPYSVPCGPLSISTRSTSYIASVRNPGKLANTPSRYVPTPLLLLLLKSSSPMPRMRNSGVLSVCEFMVERLGEMVERPSGCWMRSDWISAPLTAVTATPMSCTDSLRRSAVTTTNSRAVSLSLSAAKAATGTSSASDRMQTVPVICMRSLPQRSDAPPNTRRGQSRRPDRATTIGRSCSRSSRGPVVDPRCAAGVALERRSASPQWRRAARDADLTAR
jgi:hypothetical protein